MEIYEILNKNLMEIKIYTRKNMLAVSNERKGK